MAAGTSEKGFGALLDLICMNSANQALCATLLPVQHAAQSQKESCAH